MATKIWDAAAATPTGTHRIPADVSAAGSPTRYTVQQLADLYISTGVTAQALGNVTGATDISLAAGGIVTATATGNTTFSITNPPTAGSEWVLILTNGGAHTITWFTTTWAGGTAPTLTASGVDVIHFATPDGGTTWYGWVERDESTLAATALTGQVALANGGTGANLTDPNADRILFWDDSAGVVTWLTAGTGLALTGTTLDVTAGTDTFLVKGPLDNEPPAAAFATLDTRNGIPCLDFDSAADESAIFSGFAPEGIVLTSGIIARISWAATSATSGNVRWRVKFERRTTDQDADSWDTATEATDATNGTSGICETCEIACTTIDSIVAGDSFRVCVTRVGTDGTNDTMTGDAELFGLELRAA